MTAPDSRAAKSATLFKMSCGISADIRAPRQRVWALLTDAAGMANWNTTVTRVEGEIAAGKRLALQVPAAPGRTFKPTVTEYERDRRMVWSEGAAPMFKGVRTYTLDEGADGTTRFSMVEEFRGVMLPMIKGSLPDFAPIFETYVTDLKRAAERS